MKEGKYVNLLNGKHTKEEYINNLEIIMEKNNMDYVKFSGDTQQWTIKNWKVLKKLNVNHIKNISKSADDEYELYFEFIEHQRDLLEHFGLLKEIESPDDLFLELQEKIKSEKYDLEKIKIYEKYIGKIGSLIFKDCKYITDVNKEYLNYIVKKSLSKNNELGTSGILFSEYNIANNIYLYNRMAISATCKRLSDNHEIERIMHSNSDILTYKLTNKAKLNYDEEQLNLFNIINEYIIFLNNCTLSDGTIMEVTGRPKEIIVSDVDKRVKQKEDEVINPNLIHLRESQETLEKIKEKKDNVPKCPNCGSSSIEKITGLNRAFSIGLFGLASSKIGKTMQCKSCGYKW